MNRHAKFPNPIRLQTLIVIFACFFPFGATSAAGPEIAIRQYSFDVSGHTVEIDIRISNALNAGIKGYSLRLGYDQGLLSHPVAVTEGTWSETTDEFLLRTEPLDGIGNVSIGAVFLSPSDIAEGVLVRIRMDVSPNLVCGQSAPVWFESATGNAPKTNLFNISYNEIVAVFNDGEVSPGGWPAGDLDGNGTVNVADAVIALRIVNNDAVPATGPPGDANCDRKTGLADAVFVLQKLAGVRP